MSPGSLSLCTWIGGTRKTCPSNLLFSFFLPFFSQESPSPSPQAFIPGIVEEDDEQGNSPTASSALTSPERKTKEEEEDRRARRLPLHERPGLNLHLRVEPPPYGVDVPVYPTSLIRSELQDFFRCPADFPYPFSIDQLADHCCETRVDCRGAVLTFQSSCCFDNRQKECRAPPCDPAASDGGVLLFPLQRSYHRRQMKSHST